MPFSGEKFLGREEIEEYSRRFMSLTNAKKASQKDNMKDDGPAPPKPPRNYDSLPRGFKTSNGDTRYGKIIHFLYYLFLLFTISASPDLNVRDRSVIRTLILRAVICIEHITNVFKFITFYDN